MSVFMTKDKETSAMCDKCTFTVFVGFNASKKEVISSMGRFGWTFTKRVLCPFCAEEEGLITHEQNLYNMGM